MLCGSAEYVRAYGGTITTAISAFQIKGKSIFPTDITVPLPVMYILKTVEPLAISPFLWQDAKQMSEVGLYGITNMTVTMTLYAPGAVQSVD
jgi:hypothetical protein